MNFAVCITIRANAEKRMQRNGYDLICNQNFYWCLIGPHNIHLLFLKLDQKQCARKPHKSAALTYDNSSFNDLLRIIQEVRNAYFHCSLFLKYHNVQYNFTIFCSQMGLSAAHTAFSVIFQKVRLCDQLLNCISYPSKVMNCLLVYFLLFFFSCICDRL